MYLSLIVFFIVEIVTLEEHLKTNSKSLKIMYMQLEYAKQAI
jgi:hypothetical protein